VVPRATSLSSRLKDSDNLLREYDVSHPLSVSSYILILQDCPIMLKANRQERTSSSAAQASEVQRHRDVGGDLSPRRILLSHHARLPPDQTTSRAETHRSREPPGKYAEGSPVVGTASQPGLPQGRQRSRARSVSAGQAAFPQAACCFPTGSEQGELLWLCGGDTCGFRDPGGLGSLRAGRGSWPPAPGPGAVTEAGPRPADAVLFR
jgi:hypothetical protein